MPEDISETIQSRRERGKLAQRAYRKRHASKFQNLQEENQRLRDAIRGINAVAVRDCRTPRWPELTAALSRARDVAGLGGASFPVDDERMDEDSSETSVALLNSSRDVVDMSRNQSYPQGLSHGCAQPAITASTAPRIDHDIWLDTESLTVVSDPSPDLAAFLGPGMVTLAGCIYWACTSYTVGLWQKSSDTVNPGTATEQNIYDGLFDNSEQTMDRDFLMTLAKARVDIRSKGAASMHPSYQKKLDAITTVDLHEKMKEDFANRAGNLDWWKTPHQIENYVKQRLQPHEMERLQASVENHAPEEDEFALTAFLRSLALNYKCFGDGPRWHAMFASLAVGILIKKLRGDSEGHLQAD